VRAPDRRDRQATRRPGGDTPHPDHYSGVVEVIRGLEAPIVAIAGVDEAIRSIDPGKEEIVRPMVGDEWPT
jgi:hypothetical protein